MVFLRTTTTLLLATFASTPLFAQEQRGDVPATPDVIEKLFGCREIADPEARLACFDREADRVYRAQQSRELVIADKEQIQETRRGLFGLSLPKLGIFGSDDDDDDIEQLKTTLSSARRMSNGRYLLILEDGARWRQTEDVSGYQRYEPGDTVVISKAALGSFRASINGKRGVRVKRVN